MAQLQTTDRILEAALRLFSERGYQAVTVRELAAEVGLTSAALYHHFPSKEACLEALVFPYIERLEAVLADHPRVLAPSREDLRGLLADYLQGLLHTPDVTRLADRDPAVASHAELRSRLDAIVEDLLRRLAGDNQTPEAVVRATAALGALRRPVLRLDLDITPFANELVELTLGILRAPA